MSFLTAGLFNLSAYAMMYAIPVLRVRKGIMNRKIVIPVIVAAVAAAVGAYLWTRGHDGTKGQLALSGTVEVTEVNVGFKSAGRLAELAVDEGDRVKKGDRIAALDRAELESITAQNRAAEGVAEASLEEAKKDFERYESLVKDSVITAQQMDTAKANYDAARSQFRQAQAALAASQVRLRDAILVAPVAGVVLRKNSEIGETVAAGSAVFSLGDLENPWIKVYVKEDKLGLVKLGQKADVRTDTFPQKIYAGTVTTISSEAEFTPKNVQTRDERVKLVFAVKVSVRNENEELKPGMPADVTILLNAR